MYFYGTHWYIMAHEYKYSYNGYAQGTEILAFLNPKKKYLSFRPRDAPFKKFNVLFQQEGGDARQR